MQQRIPFSPRPHTCVILFAASRLLPLPFLTIDPLFQQTGMSVSTERYHSLNNFTGASPVTGTGVQKCFCTSLDTLMKEPNWLVPSISILLQAMSRCKRQGKLNFNALPIVCQEKEDRIEWGPYTQLPHDSWSVGERKATHENGWSNAMSRRKDRSEKVQQIFYSLMYWSLHIVWCGL